MAYKQNGVTIVDNNGNWTDRSFDSVSDISATETKITASDSAADDNFGRSVAVGCGKIVVGAALDDDDGSNSGSVYIYDLDGTNETKITASDGTVNRVFGKSVAVGSGKIVVGASSRFYIYDLNGTNEVTISKVGSAFFSTSIAIGSNKIVVGDYYADGNAVNSGTVYVYDLDGTNEIQINASDGVFNDSFGRSVDVDHGKIVVGAYGDDDDGDNSGSVYVYDLDGTNETKITASDAELGDIFGDSVAVGCGRIVVGARSSDDDGSRSGSVYVYDLNGNELAKITASDAAAGNEFGGEVAVGNGKIVVGSIFDNTDRGSVYVYDLDGTNEVKLTASDSQLYDEFGISIEARNGKVVVGCQSKQTVYVYDLPETTDIYWENIIEGFRW